MVLIAAHLRVTNANLRQPIWTAEGMSDPRTSSTR
jgi:hypothetical protein